MNDILDLSRLESGRRQLKPEVIAIRELLEQVVQSMRYGAGNRGLPINSEIGVDVPEYLSGDKQAIDQILLNLISNAVKFTEKGEVKLSAAIAGKTAEGAILELTVSDSGIGIAADKLEHIFERFTQLDYSMTKKYPGTGLGLSIVKSLTNLLGGSITVESITGKGSTFRVRIPMTPALEEKAPVIVEKKEPANVFRKLRLLLAEDNYINQIALQSMLDLSGYASDCASNGREAVDLFIKKDGGYDLILMDIQMPVMDGMAAAVLIREKCVELGKKVPIIALTGYAMPSDIERILSKGFDDYLSKPIDESQLFKKIKALT